ncbi:MAG TPA: hypothetical protein VKA70_17100 [Blastocatellia bacterium]|nr:hypothetical protein [Blastocatellia bacterium]
MPATRSPLDRIKIASPCTADWRFMLGNDLVRFCGQCNKNVYNLSAMKRRDAEDLIRRMEGQLCARYYRRGDGTILTSDCPVGLRAFKQRVSRIRTAIVAVLISFFANIGLMSLIGKGRVIRCSVITCDAPDYPIGMISYQPVVGKMMPAETVGEIVEPRTVYRSESFLRKQAIRRVVADFSSNDVNYAGAHATVKVRISEMGDVIDVNYLSGPRDIESIVGETARQWRFKPVKVEGLPVWVEGTLTFRVNRD